MMKQKENFLIESHFHGYLFMYSYDRFPLCTCKLLHELLNGILIMIFITMNITNFGSMLFFLYVS